MTATDIVLWAIVVLLALGVIVLWIVAEQIGRLASVAEKVVPDVAAIRDQLVDEEENYEIDD